MRRTKLDWLGRFGDVALAVAAVGVVAMVIVPLPTALLDLLLCINISAAVVLLLVSLYVPGALRLSTFPAILLLSTLFRLALNVSSTRLILLQADAGSVIDAFGNFVVQGNYVVGAVVFAILTIVQFVVVARGAERVSEVAARFTLDAMPGRQLAIDADLRSGAITLEEARRRRATLQREAQLFGAMDGAMKFVKGDAIAAIVIIAINVVAGIVIGVVQLGMPLGEALQTYTILTVGDGLVSQIPALLIATAAGIIVTRVAGDADHRPLGDEIARQVAAHPQALTIAAGLLVVLAVVPGLPALPFAIAAAIVAVVAYLAREHARSERVVTRRPPQLAVPTLSRLELHLSEALHERVDASRDRFDGRVRQMREAIALDLGVELPPVRVRLRDAGPTRFRVCIDEVPVTASDVDGLDQPLDAVLRELETVLRARVAEFVDLQGVQSRLDRLREESPALVAASVPEVVTLQQLADVLRRLVDEDVSIRNLGRILDAIATLGPGSHDPITIVNVVRQQLGGYLMHRFAGGDRQLEYYELDRELEAMVTGAARMSGTRPYLALQPQLAEEIVERIGARIAGVRRPVLVTAQAARVHVRELLRHELPEVVVLARQELVPTASSERVGWITA